MSKSASELIRGGKLRTAVFDVCLDPDLVAEYEALESKRSTLERIDDKTESFAGATQHGGQIAELDGQLGALLEQMQESTLTLTFQALGRAEFRALADKHPPRKDENGRISEPQDVLGVNYQTFFDELVPASLVEPKLSEQDLKILIEERLTDRQWEDLTTVVWNLNKAKVELPFSSAASKTTRTSSAK